RVEEFRDFDLLFESHRGAGRLLAVAQCGVEDDNPLTLVVRAHGILPVAAPAASISPSLSRFSPDRLGLHPTRVALVAATEEKSDAAHTEGRTGHARGTRAIANGNSVLHDRSARALCHCRIAVPPAELRFAYCRRIDLKPT